MFVCGWSSFISIIPKLWKTRKAITFRTSFSQPRTVYEKFIFWQIRFEFHSKIHRSSYLIHVSTANWFKSILPSFNRCISNFSVFGKFKVLKRIRKWNCIELYKIRINSKKRNIWFLAATNSIFFSWQKWKTNFQ